jgi:hypothetical protein
MILRRQAVFRATPLFEHECNGKVARKSGAATRAQRGSCHRTPNFSAASRAAQHTCKIMSKKRNPLFTRNARSSHPLSPTDYQALSIYG